MSWNLRPRSIRRRDLADCAGRRELWRRSLRCRAFEDNGCAELVAETQSTQAVLKLRLRPDRQHFRRLPRVRPRRRSIGQHGELRGGPGSTPAVARGSPARSEPLDLPHQPRDGRRGSRPSPSAPPSPRLRPDRQHLRRLPRVRACGRRSLRRPEGAALATAQGNALGWRIGQDPALKGRPSPTFAGPFRAGFVLNRLPRALPWAGVGWPLQGKGASASLRES